MAYKQREIGNLSGRNFGRLEVIRLYPARDRCGTLLWICRCGCGVYIATTRGRLTSGNTKSCGCAQKDAVRKTAKQNVKHAMCFSREYRSWSGMLTRCTNSNIHGYPDYGGRGIKVCKEWQDFRQFYADMGPKPYGYKLDRINVNGNYEPSNCRWVTNKESVTNRRPHVKNRDVAPKMLPPGSLEWL